MAILLDTFISARGEVDERKRAEDEVSTSGEVKREGEEGGREGGRESERASERERKRAEDEVSTTGEVHGTRTHARTHAHARTHTHTACVTNILAFSIHSMRS